MTGSRFFTGTARLDRPASRTWADETPSWLAGRAALDEADALAIGLEKKWGCGRLRLLVSPQTRQRFDNQRLKLHKAQWFGTLADVIREAGRMAKAWRALDAAAEAAGAQPLSPDVWELALSDGRVVAITRSRVEAHHVADDPRFVATYTLSDLASLIEKHGLYFRPARKHAGERVTPQPRDRRPTRAARRVRNVPGGRNPVLKEEELMSISERIALEGRGGEQARGSPGLPSAAVLRPSSSKAARRPSRCSPSRPSHSRRGR